MPETLEAIKEQEQLVEIVDETPKMKLCIVAAIGENRELGKDNHLLWHLAEDMRFFKEVTMRHYVIMGRKSFESIPAKYRPLPDRVNVIISRDPDYMVEECYTCTSLEEGMRLAEENGEQRAFLIGGGQIYKLAMDADMVDEMYITHVHGSFPDAQVYFPEFDETQWRKTAVKSMVADLQNQFSFDIYLYEKLRPELNHQLDGTSEGQIPN
nr:Dihydrofolate reductase [uncultured bacterium]